MQYNTTDFILKNISDIKLSEQIAIVHDDNNNLLNILDNLDNRLSDMLIEHRYSDNNLNYCRYQLENIIKKFGGKSDFFNEFLASQYRYSFITINVDENIYDEVVNYIQSLNTNKSLSVVNCKNDDYTNSISSLTDVFIQTPTIAKLKSEEHKLNQTYDNVFVFLSNSNDINLFESSDISCRLKLVFNASQNNDIDNHILANKKFFIQNIQHITDKDKFLFYKIDVYVDFIIVTITIYEKNVDNNGISQLVTQNIVTKE